MDTLALPALLAATIALAAQQDVRPADRPGETPQDLLTERERADGWELLFDGESMNHWRGFQKDHIPEGWQVVDGCITRVGAGGDIVTRETYADFELTLEWAVEPGGNSGIFFRVSEDPEYSYVWQTGPEMQVLDNAAHRDGLDPATSAGANYALHAPDRDVTRPAGEFNIVRLVVDGDRVEHWLNGQRIVSYELNSDDWKKRVADSKFSSMPAYGMEREGHIALQDHGDTVRFRNIKVRRLGRAGAEPAPQSASE